MGITDWDSHKIQERQKGQKRNKANSLNHNANIFMKQVRNPWGSCWLSTCPAIKTILANIWGVNSYRSACLWYVNVRDRKLVVELFEGSREADILNAHLLETFDSVPCMFWRGFVFLKRNLDFIGISMTITVGLWPSGLHEMTRL